MAFSDELLFRSCPFSLRNQFKRLLRLQAQSPFLLQIQTKPVSYYTGLLPPKMLPTVLKISKTVVKVL